MATLRTSQRRQMEKTSLNRCARPPRFFQPLSFPVFPLPSLTFPSAQPAGGTVVTWLRSESLSVGKWRRHRQIRPVARSSSPVFSSHLSRFSLFPCRPSPSPQRSHLTNPSPHGYAQNPSAWASGDGIAELLRLRLLSVGKRRRCPHMATLSHPQRRQAAKASPDHYAERPCSHCAKRPLGVGKWKRPVANPRSTVVSPRAQSRFRVGTLAP